MELDKEIECLSCNATFEVIYDDDQQVRYCPFCGYELIEELDFER